jgi:hypothetical protein
MKFANATKFNRKSGGAKWRDLLLAYSAAAFNRSATLTFVIPSEPRSSARATLTTQSFAVFRKEPYAPCQRRRDLQQLRG